MRISDWLDKVLFGAVFVVGAIGIVVGKAAGVPQITISISVVALMVCYVISCWTAQLPNSVKM
jgi:hypothetical protein